MYPGPVLRELIDSPKSHSSLGIAAKAHTIWARTPIGAALGNAAQSRGIGLRKYINDI
jgi:hypothetical protein